MATVYQAAGQTPTRVVANFDSDWKFFQGDSANAYESNFNDKTWRLLDLPHDWSIEGTINENAPAGGSGGYYPTGIGWYRKHFSIKKDDLKKENVIVFDGVYMNSDVWLNGKHLGNYPYGYNSFCYKLNSFLKEGENLLAVRVDNSKQPNSRWYSGSGIYRHVWLIRTDRLHIAQWGIYVTTPEISVSNATVAVNIKYENASSSAVKASLISQVLDDKGENAGQIESQVLVQPGKEQSIDHKVTVPSPKLWSVETPVMYSLVTKIMFT